MVLESSRKWRLRQFHTNDIIDLPTLAQTDVGRDESAGVCLRTSFVNFRHAAFVCNWYGNLLLRDLRSHCGTFVNNQPLPMGENEALAHGNIVSFGIADYDRRMSDEFKKCFFEVLGDERSAVIMCTLTAKDDEISVPLANNGTPSVPKPNDTVSPDCKANALNENNNLMTKGALAAKEMKPELIKASAATSNEGKTGASTMKTFTMAEVLAATNANICKPIVNSKLNIIMTNEGKATPAIMNISLTKALEKSLTVATKLQPILPIQ